MDRPILFNTQMVRAILDGKKTQTRRVANRDNTLYCPYGRPKDTLWVRETWANDIPFCPNGITYRADHQNPKGDGPANPIKWRPSIFMPRRASRIALEIIGVRLERLQEIPEPDVMQEAPPEFWTHPDGPVGAFIKLWDSINAKRGFGWDANPLVWVINFNRV